MSLSEKMLQLQDKEPEIQGLQGNGFSEVLSNGCPVNYSYIDVDEFLINNLNDD